MGFTRSATGADAARARGVRVVLWAILGLNLAVAAAKYFYGVATASISMQADGFHSLFDGTSNIVGLIGLAVAVRPPDRDHPYGHAKYETYAAAIIGAMLLLASWKVGSAAWQRLSDGGEPPRVDAGSFIVMIVTLGVNIGVATWERRMGRKLRSELLVADASHTASDILVSVGVLVGLVAVRLGWPLADPLLALLVAGAILWTAGQVLRQADRSLSDTARLPTPDVCAVALGVPGVLGCHSIRTRGAEAAVYVDLHIQVDPAATVGEGHRVAEAVERAICDRFPEVADVLAHLEPYDAYQAGKTKAENVAGALS
ncbi:MAG TPA: cation diffusion facilitator family transporter [bacterium]